MAHSSIAHGDVVTTVPVREILPWAIFGGLLFLLAMYFVGVEEGATAIFNSMY
ncbi:MAG TPA: CbtB-domain containing protein, partial [Hyphomicrobium sp.]|nr:CbtB-domain containing protein [Hyphomicrobium sp.]